MGKHQEEEPYGHMAWFDGVAMADPLASVRVDVSEQPGRDALEPEQELPARAAQPRRAFAMDAVFQPLRDVREMDKEGSEAGEVPCSGAQASESFLT